VSKEEGGGGVVEIEDVQGEERRGEEEGERKKGRGRRGEKEEVGRRVWELI
jgi:hypothetical protein